jgi:putative copper resistance protein D
MDMDDSSLNGWLAAVRAVHFACCLLTAGVWFFDRLIVPRPPPPWRRIAGAILLVVTPLALVSGAAWFALVAASMSDLPFTTLIRNLHILDVVWSQTRFGRAWQIHLLFWLSGAAVALMFAIRRCKSFFPGWIGAASGAGLVAGLAWAGHGSTGPVPYWHMMFDITHLLTASVWPAGLLPFALLLHRLARGNEPGRWIELDRITRRFSAASLTAVGLMVVTGVFNSWCLLGPPGNLFRTGYGRVLLMKLAIFVVMVGIGAINLLVLKPRMSDGELPARWLWRNVMIEIALGIGVIAVVGILGLLEPSRPVLLQ